MSSCHVAFVGKSYFKGKCLLKIRSRNNLTFTSITIGVTIGHYIIYFENILVFILLLFKFMCFVILKGRFSLR